ncbi:RNA 2',3'-cyclic phosphodiesterase [Oleiagrimonas sp. C23AA]|uniref:RNA 2',3'-cyclic phosphodiesterase n=1 Tax=Oleiagrimonas sp. C23AA TaxID=2719047 RepID=UPI0014231130|nr:RNA 2',3'-cyclic phosphodiesterase [Oleiagrimonas sp. C23AA]NII10075.1 RNA 2',3'-cyclic phosphodiesterase [Oleiagrimonas sp. C23AA]
MALSSSAPRRIRAFIALCPDAESRQQLVQLQRELRPTLPAAARWPHADDLHLTLRFLGAIDPTTLAQVTARLQALSVPTLPPVRTESLQAWPQPQHARVLVLSTQLNTATRELAERCEQIATACGLAANTRAFRPHITLARPPAGASSPLQASLPPTLGFDGLALMQSAAADAQGRRYRRLAHGSLAHP